MEIAIESWTPEHSRLLAALPGAEQERIARYRAPADRIRGLVGALLPRLVIANREKKPLDQIHLPRSAKGKPYHPDDPGFCFNLSHSGELVALAIGPAPVGVDCEQIRPARDWQGIARRFFTAAERHWLASVRTGDLAQRFFELWSRKESLLKATGDGLSGSISALSVCPESDDDSRVDFQGQSWFIRTYRNCPGYSVALSSASPWLPAEPICVDARAELMRATSEAVHGMHPHSCTAA